MSKTKKKDPRKVAAGRLGGLATAQRRGRAWMQEIGRRGAEVFHKRYRLEPFDLSDFAIYDRETGDYINSLKGKKHRW